jgi:hypothetical protein
VLLSGRAKDRTHLMAARDQQLGERGAEVPGGAGDEGLHAVAEAGTTGAARQPSLPATPVVSWRHQRPCPGGHSDVARHRREVRPAVRPAVLRLCRGCARAVQRP